MTPEKERHDGEWVLVPRELTTEMRNAAYLVSEHTPGGDQSIYFERLWQAMLAAPPAALGTQEGGRFSDAEKIAAVLFADGHYYHAETVRLLASHARTIEALRAALRNAVVEFDIIHTGIGIFNEDPDIAKQTNSAWLMARLKTAAHHAARSLSPTPNQEKPE